MFVGGHDADAIWVEIDESEDGNGRMSLGEEVQKLACLDIWIAFGLAGNQI